MELRAGQKLYSASSNAQFVVVRAPAGAAVISHGGAPLLDHEPGDGETVELVPSSGDDVAIGKRYVDEELGLELLCAKAGGGDLEVDGRALTLKGAKPLPSSD